ncbi:MAG: DUF222 domain-containing protein [bacterium]|nr:DUF222 domain-containing protein [bacterium]
MGIGDMSNASSGPAGGVAETAGCAEGPAAMGEVLTSAVVVAELSDGGLEEHLRLLARAKSRLAALDADAVAEFVRRRGEAGTVEMLREVLGQARGAAKREVQFAEMLAALPATAEALLAGEITPPHARIIAEAAGKVAVDEAELAAMARREHLDRFRRSVREHVNARIGDDLEERRRHQRAEREVNIKQHPDGMYTLFGRFDPVAGNRIETAILAAANRLWHAEDPKDRPTTTQRLADALEMLVTRHGDGKAQGVDLLVIAEYDAVAGQLQNPCFADGTPLTPEELLRLACDAKILPALFDVDGQPLWLGQARRRATAGQRAVITKRDGGCVGCGANANWCQVHHVVHWLDGGPTDVDNMCLLCSHCHHHLVHGQGADIVRQPDGRFGLELPNGRRPRPPPGRPTAGRQAPLGRLPKCRTAAQAGGWRGVVSLGQS